MVGDQVSSGDTAVRVDDLTHVAIDVSVSEIDISSVKVGQPAKITFDAIANKSYDGKITKVAVAGTSSQGVVQFPVTVELTNPDAKVLQGLTATVEIVTQEKSNVLIVPNKAIHTQSGQKYVIVLLEGKQTQVPVTTGLVGDSYTEIASGSLQAGDEVVVTGTSNTTSSSTTSNNRQQGGGDFGGGPGGVPGIVP